MATDEETLRQLAELRDEITAKRAEREATRRRLHNLEERAAEMGRDTPHHITDEIGNLIGKRRDLDTIIAELGRQRVRLELAPTPGIYVPQGEVLPQLAPAVIDTRLQSVERAVDRQGQSIDRILERLDAGAEWSERQDKERRDGQSWQRWVFTCIAVALAVLALGIVLVAIRVY